jgi:hypothetical protein
MDRKRREPSETEEFRDLRDVARSLGAPQAPEDLIARVVAERQSGVRTAMPGGEPISARPPVRRGVLAGAAAVLIVGLVALFRWPATNQPAAREGAQGVCAMNPETRGWLVASSFLLATACAQEPGAAPSEPAAPAAELGAHQLQEGTWVYRVREQRQDRPDEYLYEYIETYTLARVGSGDQAQWVSGDTKQRADDRRFADTVFYTADGLRPTRQVIHIARDGRDLRVLRFTFGPDSSTMISDYLGYRGMPPAHYTSSGPGLPPGSGPVLPAIHNPGLVNLAGLLPLAPGWAGSVRLTAPAEPSDVANLEVVGEETVTVPAGTFDCWRMTVDQGGLIQALWVSKERQLVVRSLRGNEGSGLESALVSFTLVKE